MPASPTATLDKVLPAGDGTWPSPAARPEPAPAADIVAVAAHNAAEGYHEVVWVGEKVRRDRRGRTHRHPTTLFARVVCNNPECAFEALVNPEAFVATAVTGAHR